MKLSGLRKKVYAIAADAGDGGTVTRAEADTVIMSCLGIDFTHMICDPDREITDEDCDAITEKIFLVKSGCPVQYAVGKAPFLGRFFTVSDKVLIPRQDTEVLFYEAEARAIALSAAGTGRLKILDMCTGSGILAVSLALAFPGAEVTASDISEDALAVAARNAIDLGARGIRFVRSDCFGDQDAFGADGKFDLIVSNPPYVASGELPALPESVRSYEPAIALAGGEDGLDFYRGIATDGRSHLNAGGWLCFEIGDTQARAVKDILCSRGFYSIGVTRDIAGRDRVVCGKYG